MATSGDVTVAQDGGQGNVKLHPYLITLVRWCVSCVWSTASILLHRLMTTPLQPITGPKPVPARNKVPRRAAGTEHLHPEPRVECQLLHHPAIHTMDVIFVHGLYGSLGNTWRQGDWRQKYVADPKIVTLRGHSKLNICQCNENSTINLKDNEIKCDDTKGSEKTVENHINNKNNCYNDDVTNLNNPETSVREINEKLAKKVIPKENDLITEQFYNNTLRDQVNILENYDTQAKFVHDMFKKETDCDKSCENKFKYNEDDNRFKGSPNSDNNFKCIYNSRYSDDIGFKCDPHNLKNDDNSDNDFKLKFNKMDDFNECKCNSDEKSCEVGCGCLCNDCYSTCWPKDWIKADFPGARVISINYTSDPYLWRPLWIKENKRLNLYQRAEQMMEQLLDMGVGEKPIVWVGHSKGGLFIKQIYCEAYDAHMKMNKNFKTNDKIEQVFFEKTEETSLVSHNGITAENIDTIIEHFNHTQGKNTTKTCTNSRENNFYSKENRNCTRRIDNYITANDNYTRENDNHRRNKDNIPNNNACVINETIEYENVFEQIWAKNNDNFDANVINDNIRNLRIENGDEKSGEKLKDAVSGIHNLTSSTEAYRLSRRASLWRSSRGFMFYSVPHRGSPLADIKTPVTARSVDLLEIAKDCPLVLELQSRWELAMGGPVGSRPSAVRSVVETCRTLMSVLWLRIVSTESADAGFGTLSGISVDHREICKPTSRKCPLYIMLTDLIQEATTCTC